MGKGNLRFPEVPPIYVPLLERTLQVVIYQQLNKRVANFFHLRKGRENGALEEPKIILFGKED
jgi:hypothetical protein